MSFPALRCSVLCCPLTFCNVLEHFYKGLVGFHIYMYTTAVPFQLTPFVHTIAFLDSLCLAVILIHCKSDEVAFKI